MKTPQRMPASSTGHYHNASKLFLHVPSMLEKTCAKIDGNTSKQRWDNRKKYEGENKNDQTFIYLIINILANVHIKNIQNIQLSRIITYDIKVTSTYLIDN